MCGIGVVLAGAPVDWVPANLPGTAADGFAPPLVALDDACACADAAAPSAAPVHPSYLRARGPDGAHTISVRVGSTHACVLHVTASVLHVRGDTPALQPVCTRSGSALAWNGELFARLPDAAGPGTSDAPGRARGPEEDSAMSDTDERESDTLVLARALERARSPLDVTAALRGPWALAWWQHERGALWVGRDPVGRRSLLVCRAPRGVAVCSVAVPIAELFGEAQPQPCGLGPTRGRAAPAPPSDVAALAGWAELPPLPHGGLWRISLAPPSAGSDSGCAASAAAPPAERIVCEPHVPPPPVPRPLRHLVSAPRAVEQDAPCGPAARELWTDALYSALSDAVRVRVRAIGRVGRARAAAPAADAVDAPPPAAAERAAAAAAAAAGAARVGVGVGAGVGVGVGVLFSGGIDSMVLAALAGVHAPPDAPIELINVALSSAEIAVRGGVAGSGGAAGGGRNGGPRKTASPEARAATSRPTRAPDRLSAVRGLHELRAAFPQREWRLVLADVSARALREAMPAVEARIFPAGTVMDLTIGLALWFGARAQGRLVSVARAGASSGGEDAGGAGAEGSELELSDEDEAGTEAGAALRHALPADATVGATADERAWMTPMRGAARAACRYAAPHASAGSCAPARRVLTAPRCPRDAVRVSIHITRPAPHCGAEPAISLEIAPCAPAESGRAERPRARAGGMYTCCARVLLVGTGADEQLGGYGRHRVAYARRGQPGLDAELATDVRRLWVRNLGRDDRVISEHGREPRHPFLDEGVMRVIREAPAGALFDLELEPGVGDKRALREIGRRLGLRASTRLQKRAIQFGTRLANKKLDGRAPLRSGAGAAGAAADAAGGGAPPAAVMDTLSVDDLLYRGDGVPQPQLRAHMRKQPPTARCGAA